MTHGSPQARLRALEGRNGRVCHGCGIAAGEPDNATAVRFADWPRCGACGRHVTIEAAIRAARARDVDKC